MALNGFLDFFQKGKVCYCYNLYKITIFREMFL